MGAQRRELRVLARHEPPGLRMNAAASAVSYIRSHSLRGAATSDTTRTAQQQVCRGPESHDLHAHVITHVPLLHGAAAGTHEISHTWVFVEAEVLGVL